MTVYELLAAGAALFFENDLSGYADLAVGFVNMLLAECFETNNRIRRRAGKAALVRLPVLKDLKAYFRLTDAQMEAYFGNVQ